MFIAAQGWVAKFQNGITEEIVFWTDEDDDEEIIGLVLSDDSYGFVPAPQVQGFINYEPGGHQGFQYFPAAPGWWIEWKNEMIRERILFWAMTHDGQLQAFPAPGPGSEGESVRERPGVHFVYDPGWGNE